MNYEEQSKVNLSFTLWKKTVINGNMDKLLSINIDENSNEDDIREMEDRIDLNDPSNIIFSMKFVSDVYI